MPPRVKKMKKKKKKAEALAVHVDRRSRARGDSPRAWARGWARTSTARQPPHTHHTHHIRPMSDHPRERRELSTLPLGDQTKGMAPCALSTWWTPVCVACVARARRLSSRARGAAREPRRAPGDFGNRVV